MAWFENLNTRTNTRIQELRNGGSSSAAFQQQNDPNMLDAPIDHTGGLIGPSTILGQNYTGDAGPIRFYISLSPVHNTFASGGIAIEVAAGPSQFSVPLSSACNLSHNLPTDDGTEEAGPSYQGNKNP
ncbi:hypothetical protein BUALT_Bualt10G0092400 [Buddleja alternifolia]|uniref:Uncharacterized protein n=1 Tax=Buddleja alternifolia TaxID=168488 RepID=A0AAV6X5I1_9LAMI|nr:hypothetical protein BUALT_Bualt10G0092400 [Buddleja alternifolia]